MHKKRRLSRCVPRLSHFRATDTPHANRALAVTSPPTPQIIHASMPLTLRQLTTRRTIGFALPMPGHFAPTRRRGRAAAVPPFPCLLLLLLLCSYQRASTLDIRLDGRGNVRKSPLPYSLQPVPEEGNKAGNPVPADLMPFGPSSTAEEAGAVAPVHAPLDGKGVMPPPPITSPPPAPIELSEAEALKLKQELYAKDMRRGTIFDMDDAPDDILEEAPVGASMRTMEKPLDAAPADGEAATEPEAMTSASSMASSSTAGAADEALMEQETLVELAAAENNGDDFIVTAMRSGAGSAGGRPGGNVQAIRSAALAATALARQGVAAAQRQAGVGAGAIASPAVLNMPRPGLALLRVVFVAFKRIGAMNVDFNLPVSPGDRFGSAVAVLLPAGDLDSDYNTLEVVVGAPGDHTYMKRQGAVFILSLANFGTTLANYRKIIPGEGVLAGQACKYASFGTAVTSLGDLNNDGYADIAVGAPFQEDTGVVYILFLAFGGSVAKYIKIGGCDKFGGGVWGNPYFGNPHYPSPLAIGDEFGCSIANIGDLNGDGVPDLVVGACGDTDSKKGWAPGSKGQEACVASGAIYILFMNIDGTVKYHRKISARSGNLLIGPEPGDRFGASVALVGHRNGCTVIAVGAPFADGAGHEVGAVYVLELLQTGDVKRFEILSSAYVPAPPGSPRSQYMYMSAPLASHDYFGSAVAALDVDRDGVCDLLVGSRGLNQRTQDEGAAFACYLDGVHGGLLGWEQVASQSGVLVPVQPGEQFGAAIAVLDDLSRNPSSLIFVGAPGGCMDAVGGAVYVLRVQPIGG